MSAQHPGWCDPRLCSDSVSNREHLEAPMVFSAREDDLTVSVGLSRLDEIGMFEIDGNEHIRLTLRDTASLTPGGEERSLDVDLTAEEARMLSAMLDLAAVRLDAKKPVA